MAGDRQLLTAGITTIQLAVGISAITRLTLGAQVVGVKITHVSGGTLFMMGASNAVATGVSLGVFIPSTGVSFEGYPDIYLVAAGAATIAHVVKQLAPGFAGQY